jgi:hypothetical protein
VPSSQTDRARGLLRSPATGGTSTWREDFTRLFGVLILTESTLATSRHRLWATRCCRVKSELGGTPRDMYGSALVQRFLAFAEARGLAHAIVSDKYGLHFPDQHVAHYDLAPWQLTTTARRTLGQTIGGQARRRGHQEIVFYNTSPLMSRPYCEILSHSGLRVFFTTQLPALEVSA